MLLFQGMVFYWLCRNQLNSSFIVEYRNKPPTLTQLGWYHFVKCDTLPAGRVVLRSV